MGVLSIKECQQVIASSQVNLLLSWTTPNFTGIFPGKFYEYLSVKQPILLIINGDQDPLWETKFNTIGCGFYCYEQEAYNAELADFIVELYQDWYQGKKSASKMNKEEVAKYLWANQMPEFLEKIGKKQVAETKKKIETYQKRKYIKKTNGQPILIKK